MLVWGGWNGSYLNSGGRYDPATDAWHQTSIAAVPSPRRQHTAVWTGSRMLVWGGYGGSLPYLVSGRQFDPATDTWTATSTVDAPLGRGSHTAVWTGGHMLVWGGFSDGLYLNTGGRYALGHSFDDDDDGYTECTGDCNDGNASIFPGAQELCDGLDNDCNFMVDEQTQPPQEITGLTFESESTLS